MSAPPLVLVAIATDGYNERENQLLEVGAIAVDRDLPGHKLAEFSAIVAADPELVLNADQQVAAMHSENGLIEALIDGQGSTAPVVDLALVSWLEEIGAAGDCLSPLIGNNTDFLHRWMSKYLKRSRGRLHTYDTLDLNVLRRALFIPKPTGTRVREVLHANHVLLQACTPGASRLLELRKGS